MTSATPLASLCLSFLFILPLCGDAQAQSSAEVAPLRSVDAETGSPAPAADSGGGADLDSGPVLPILPRDPAAPIRQPRLPSGDEAGVDWSPLFHASGRFLAVEHLFRLITEPGTRAGLKGSFLQNYAKAVGNLHGWADGDPFYVNYVGHPMQGSVAGFLWLENDRKYRHTEFGKNHLYWKSRLRAAAFAWAQSTQFEIGILSEASIGGIQAIYPQQGFVDHVITPTLGMGWMVAEDAIDKYFIRPIEDRTTNRWARLVARLAMNPSRSFANLMQAGAPWHRETRPGVLEYRPPAAKAVDFREIPTAGSAPESAEAPGPAPFEFSPVFQAEHLSGSGGSSLCAGGSGTAALRLNAIWQIGVEVGGCKLLGLGRDLSGDSLTYMAGPRWVHAGAGPWSGHLQFLIGGNKMTMERIWPEKKKFLETIALLQNSAPPSHSDYTEQVETNAFAVAAGGGVDYKLNRAVAIRVAEISYRRSWVGPLWGREYTDGVKIISGLILRMGTW